MASDNESKTSIALVDPLVGSIFDKRFRVEDRIAAGGFGAIYRATHVKSGHPIALKVLLPTLAQDLGIVARFRREGDTLTALRNPHTITAYELGQAADRTLFIVMELLHGETLFERYEANGPLEWRRMARIARQVCESLDEAHARGIVHRDLKPTNIHLEEVDGDPDFVKVLDFGIAKILMGSDFDASDITNAGTMIGTLDYMSPEQMVGGQVTGQTDIYTLGIVMYEMIAGVRPFPEAQSAAAALGAMLKTTPQPLYLRAPVPEQISKIVMRCLERETHRRYRSVADLMKDLDEVLGAGGSDNVLVETKPFELDDSKPAVTADEEATAFTPPPEKLLQELRTPKVERVERPRSEWDDEDEYATTMAAARHEERAASRAETKLRSDERGPSRAKEPVRFDERAPSRAETNVLDGIDPHGPTVAARPIEDSGARTPPVRPDSEGAKTPTVRREGESGTKTPTTARRDGDTGGSKTPTTVRRDLDADRANRSGGLDADRANRSGGLDPDSRRSSGLDPSVRPKSATRPPMTPDPEAARPKSATRPPLTPDLDAARPKSATRPPQTPDPERGRASAPSGIPPTPPVRPLQARNLPTPVPQIVVAPFSSTPRAPTAPPMGMPTPPPGSLPPGVPMPPTRPTPPAVNSPHVPTPPGTPAYPGSPPGTPAYPGSPPGTPAYPGSPPVPTPPGMSPYGAPNPFAVPGSNPSANPFAVPGSNPSASPFAVPGSNPSASPFATPGSNPGASPFPASNPFLPTTPGSNPFASPLPSTPPQVPRPQYDMTRVAAREAMIRRVTWIVALVVAAVIGFAIAMGL